MGDIMTDSGGGAWKSNDYQENEKANGWGALGDDGGLTCQAPSHPDRWDKSEKSLPSMGKGEAICGQQKVLDLTKEKE